MANYKVVDSEKLNNDLSAVADSIKAKTSKNEPLIFPEGFTSAIDEIGTSDGDIGKPYIDTSKMTYFYYFFNKNPLLLDDIDKIDTSNGTNFSYMFSGCSKLQTIPQLDTSNGTEFNDMFSDCDALQTIPPLNLSKGKYFSNMFEKCHSLITIPQLDTSNGTSFTNMFNACYSLIEIPTLDISNGTSFYSVFYDCRKLETVSLTTAKSNLATSTFQNCTGLKNITIGEGWNVNIYLNYSNELTVESLHGMIENLADLTGKTAKTFQVGATNLAKIDAEHLTMLQNKNWNYS